MNWGFITIGALAIAAIIATMNSNVPYLTLKIVSALMRIVGWVLIAVACGLVWLATQSGMPNPGDTVGAAVFGITFATSFVIGVGFAVGGLTLVASGELIWPAQHAEFLFGPQHSSVDYCNFKVKRNIILRHF